MTFSIGLLLVLSLYREGYLRPLDYMAFCGNWEGRVPINRFEHTSWMAVDTPTDRPKSVHNRCVIEFLVAFLCCDFLFFFILTPLNSATRWIQFVNPK